MWLPKMYIKPEVFQHINYKIRIESNMKFLAVLVCVFASVLAQEYELIWEDNFLDPNKWQHEITAWGGGNGEFQAYTPDPKNSYTENGKMFIRPTRTVDNINPLTGEPFGEDFLYNGVLDLNEMYGGCTMRENDGCRRDSAYGMLPPVMSARLQSSEKFSVRFGRIEVRARLPLGDWMWPAIWMLPENSEYGPWPLSGEIDIVEARGNSDLKIPGGIDIGIQEAASTLHWGLDADQNRYFLTNGPRRNFTNDYANSFHDYVVEWNENGLRFYLDEEVILDVPNPLIPNNPEWTGFWEFGQPWFPGFENPWIEKSIVPKIAPFDKPFYFIMNVAVGGNNGYFPDSALNKGGAEPKPWDNDSPTPFEDFWGGKDTWYSTWDTPLGAMEVDYIRVYQKA